LQTFLIGWPANVILLISASQVARITGISHWSPGHNTTLILTHGLTGEDSVVLVLIKIVNVCWVGWHAEFFVYNKAGAIFTSIL
jgi:hypothetical protein